MSTAAFLALTNRLADTEAKLRQVDVDVKTAFQRWTRHSQQQAELINDRAALLRAIAHERAILEQKEGNP